MNWEEFLKTLLHKISISDYKLDVDAEHHHASLFIHEEQGFIKDNLPLLVESFNHLIQLIARKQNEPPLFLDVNNYRKERENLIRELVRATTRKVLATKQEVPLPAMNSYERRLAHMELAAHPDVITESIGKGKGRYVVIKPIGSGPAGTIESANQSSSE